MPRHYTEEKRQKLLDFIKAAGPDGISSKQAAKLLGSTSDNAVMHLTAMIDQGLIERNFPGRGGPWCRYGLPGIRERYENRPMTPQQARKIMESRRYRERKKLEKEESAEMPVLRIFRLASEAPPIQINAPVSVFNLKEYV